MVFRSVPRLGLVFVLACAPLTSGCGALLPALAKVGAGAQYLGTLLDVAHVGADAYLARHPNAEAEAKVAKSERRARLALAALEHALTASDASEKDIAVARTEALRAYADLRSLLGELGVLDARPASGGAESEAPLPEPLPLPTEDEVAARLSSAGES